MPPGIEKPLPRKPSARPRANRISSATPVEDVRRGATMRDIPEESLMLSGDENIVDVDFAVFWVIKPDRGATQYLFNIQILRGP